MILFTTVYLILNLLPQLGSGRIDFVITFLGLEMFIEFFVNFIRAAARTT